MTKPIGRCVECREEIDDPAYAWPGKAGTLCQDCWETECSREWWRWMSRMDSTLSPTE